MKTILAILILFTSSVFASDNKGLVELTGKLFQENAKISDVTIELLKNGIPEAVINTNDGDSFTLQFETEQLYQVSISKPGFFTQKFIVDTKNVDAADGAFKCMFAIELIPFVTGVDAGVFDTPIADITYNERVDDFVKNIDKMTQTKIKQFFNEYADAKTKLYNGVIKNADVLFAAQDYETALVLYNEAILLDTNDDYAEMQVEYINRIIAQDLRAQLRFDEKLQKADLYFASHDFKKAKKYYQKALKIKEDNYPASQILCIEKVLLSNEVFAKN